MARIIHFEIPMGDPKSFIPFYQKVFNRQIYKCGGREYRIAATGEGTEPGMIQVRNNSYLKKAK